MKGLESLPPTFTTAEAHPIGVHPRDLYWWRDTGLTLELSRGVFRQADAPTPNPHAKSFLEWQVKGEDYLISVWNTLLNM